jgi:hypothetical protein
MGYCYLSESRDTGDEELLVCFGLNINELSSAVIVAVAACFENTTTSAGYHTGVRLCVVERKAVLVEVKVAP